MKVPVSSSRIRPRAAVYIHIHRRRPMTTVSTCPLPLACSPAQTPGAAPRSNQRSHMTHTHHPPDTDRKCRQCHIIPRAHPRDRLVHQRGGERRRPVPPPPGSRQAATTRANTQDTSRDTHTASHGRRGRHSSRHAPLIVFSSPAYVAGWGVQIQMRLISTNARVSKPRGASGACSIGAPKTRRRPRQRPPNHRSGPRPRCRRRRRAGAPLGPR